LPEAVQFELRRLRIECDILHDVLEFVPSLHFFADLCLSKVSLFPSTAIPSETGSEM
jgi:hypothetical protein